MNIIKKIVVFHVAVVIAWYGMGGIAEASEVTGTLSSGTSGTTSSSSQVEGTVNSGGTGTSGAISGTVNSGDPASGSGSISGSVNGPGINYGGTTSANLVNNGQTNSNVPGLPNTGFGPDEQGNPDTWYAAGLIAAMLALAVTIAFPWLKRLVRPKT